MHCLMQWSLTRWQLQIFFCSGAALVLVGACGAPLAKPNRLMSTSYTCDQTALLKILLHAAKYPAAAVNGILLGRISSDKSTVELVDAVPLLHSFLTLAPALETALIQVSSHARQEGLQLLGYYHANERFDDTELGSSARKVADKLYSHNPAACAVLVNSPKLAKGLKAKSGEFLQAHVKDEGGRNWVSSNLKYDSGSVLSVLPEMCSQGRHQRLSDFDDHLNDISRDWRNPELLS